jgi:hypothetical protein
MTPGLCLDAGALIAFERHDRKVYLLLNEVQKADGALVVPAGVVAQVWRDGRMQARLARLLALEELEVEVLDDLRARAAGQLCGVTGTSDIVDASVVLTARVRRLPIVTSDPEDLRRLDPHIPLIVI